MIEFVVDNWIFCAVLLVLLVCFVTMLFLMGTAKKNKDYDEAFEKQFGEKR